MSQSKFALPRNGFTFKQFFVAHDRCAMKVGTDGILLGAWAPIAQVKRMKKRQSRREKTPGILPGPSAC